MSKQFGVALLCMNCDHKFTEYFPRGTVLTSSQYLDNGKWRTYIGPNGRFEDKTVPCPNCAVDHVRKAVL